MDTNFNKDINNVDRVNFKGLKDLIKRSGKKAPELKEVEGSAQDALGAQGRAFVNMGKTSSKEKVEEESIKIKNLTAEEFEEKKKEIEKHIEKLPNSIKEKFNNIEFNKFNIFITEYILDNSELFKNKSVIENLDKIMTNTHSDIVAKAKFKMVNEVLAHPEWLKIKSIDENLGEIIAYNYSEDETDCKCRMMDEILAHPEWLKIKSVADKFGDIVSGTNSENGVNGKCKMMDEILAHPEWLKIKNIAKNLGEIVQYTYSENGVKGKCKMMNEALAHPEWLKVEGISEKLGDIVSSTYSEDCSDCKCKMINEILAHPELLKIKSIAENLGYIIVRTNSEDGVKGKCKMMDEVLAHPEWLKIKNISENLVNIIAHTNSENEAKGKSKIINEVSTHPKLLEIKSIAKTIGHIMARSCPWNEINGKYKIIMEFSTHPEWLKIKNIDENLGYIIQCTNSEDEANAKCKIINELSNHPELLKIKSISENLRYIISTTNKTNEVDKLIEFINKAKKDPKLASIPPEELMLSTKLSKLYNINNINEIPIGEKRNVLRELASCNAELFETTKAFQNMFPLVPKNQNEYCELLPQLVKSIGIESKDLSEGEIKEFDKNLISLSDSLARLSNEDFNNLEITQSYPKEEFIKDTLEIVSGLEDSEKQKVYDYFGFELKENENSKIGYSIIGYPKNINNGKKLAQIEDENTKAVVEKLRTKVIEFSENNTISVKGNDAIANELNEIVKAFPELRTMIGKAQHKTHEFDLMMHSLKVIQNFSKDPDFNKLNDSDKRLMLLAGLFHDITKAEGRVDKTHAKESAFDCSFLIERLNLNQDEEFKLDNLIRNHEWLEYANKDDDSNGIKKRLQDVAYDFRFDNAFDMAMMFTKADLLGVKKDNNDGNRFATEFMDKALSFEPKIRENIEELKKSQPLLPVTKIPKASVIGKAITVVNDDGSTNIKGVYKDKKGLVIIKFNEVEDWEAIGFPKGSVSKGIETKTSRGDDVDTGNIHFFAHGLEYPNQLIKFDAFSLSDSDALLSVSYAERPESKYRFFRPQGVLLDCDTKYIHGGGETDAGSGCGKDIQDFKNEYIFEGESKGNRLFISDLIKKALADKDGNPMSDSEYVQFVKENENKPFSEIEPVEIREKIIKALSEINSNERFGNREYNEMYISNPYPPMAVFAYETENGREIQNPVEFLNREEQQKVNRCSKEIINNKERTGFLQDYARERDIPFIIFGD